MKTIVITGFTSGIGLEVTRLALQHGHRVIAIGRNSKKITSVVDQLSSISMPEQLIPIEADLASFRQIRHACDSILELTKSSGVDVFIHNAAIVPKWRMLSEEGYEMQFAVNHLSGFLVFKKLEPRLLQNQGLVLVTSSRSHRHTCFDFDNLMLERGYHMLRAYKRSKLANVLFVSEINRRFQSRGLIAIAMDPGLVNTQIGLKNTSGIENWFWKIRGSKGKDPSQVAPYYVDLIESNLTTPNTGFNKLGQFLTPSKNAQNPYLAKKL